MQVGVEVSGESGGRAPADVLLSGAYDIHRHGYPETSFDSVTRRSDVDNLICSRDAGLKAVVLKSHFWPTVGRACHLNDLVPGIDVVPSITLNPDHQARDRNAASARYSDGCREEHD